MYKVLTRAIPEDVDGAQTARLLSRCEWVTGGCLVWTGWRDPDGYGVTRISRRRVFVHRAAYTWSIGPIPDGLVIDHLCRNRACCNPDHLEPVTNAENLHRGRPLEQTHCKHGHEFTPQNTRTTSGSRVCRACEVRRNAEYRNRRSA